MGTIRSESIHMLKTTGRMLAAVLLSGAGATCVLADPVADFYRGRRITMVIGYSAGGGYDQYAQALARFYGEHIPGHPVVVPRAMPGAGSRVAANWLYNAAPRDGTVVGVVAQSTPLDQVLGEAGVQFDAARFLWIGNMVIVNNVLVTWHTSGVKTIDDAKRKAIPIAASGGTSQSMVYPQVSNNLLGTKFKIISGYRGGGDINIAMERGEVAGRGGASWASWKSTKPDWVRDKKINILFQAGPKREPDLQDVPLWSELTDDPEKRQVLEVLSDDVTVGRPVMAPPGVPADRAEALRAAFDATMKDPRFVEEAGRLKMDINPIGGAELQTVVGKVVGLDAGVVGRIKEALRPREAGGPSR
jgi:tripartite-type tricarboxylate transporter receptor subunit TctC